MLVGRKMGGYRIAHGLYSRVVEIRSLTVADVPACMNVATDRGWSHSAPTWEFLLTMGTGWGMFDGDELVGTTVVTRYSGMSAISMVLVVSRYERQGIAGKLVSQVLDDGVQCLYATSFGKALYERLGFHSVGKITTYSGTHARREPAHRGGADASDLPRIVDLDAKAFGVERPVVWERLLTHGSVRFNEWGAVGAIPNHEATMIGPVVVATSPVQAIALISDAAAAANGPAKVHLADDWVAHHIGVRGLDSVGSSCDLMVRNADDVPGDRSRYFAPASMALG
jgi:hypothetical protein